ncbi:Sporulation and cell division protein [Streptomyces sp. YIM 130001]|uniref:SsgA family sporulation/cell division regulator n=1 Tax=Streptomyces sp. YIM 130001 TaxID=2259644 RepID=UPI000EE80DB0|nr:SsgA family sporulation/cell division regulator [Streptomyces sp. YIM 130001]RII17746.1 Sporulation and cell division protein [Streptomyces sp. YIM 130001]
MADADNGPNSSDVWQERASPAPRATGEWLVKFMLAEGWAVPMLSRFTYLADDPYAVHLEFHLAMKNPVRWAFAREILIEGVLRSTGRGDVRAWPTYEDTLWLCLHNLEGEALVEMPIAPLNDWLERTYELVSPGQEHRHQALDADTWLWHLVNDKRPDGGEGKHR